MGKISEALKKAGKEKRIRPFDQEEERMVPDNTNAASKPMEIPQSSPKKAAIHTSAPSESRVAAPVEKAVVVETPLPSRHPSHAMSDTDAGQDMPEPPDVAAPMAQPLHTREPETSNVVPVRPSPFDESASPVNSVPPPAASAPTHVQAKRFQEKPARGDIQISYSRTKVQAFDPEKLKNNKIFSIFDEIETTDQIKILRTQVLKKLKEIGGNSILVTSAHPYEGKTFTSINLGVSIAKEFSRTVLIIDADLRKPTKRHTAFSTEFFTLDVEVGLTDYLKGEADIPDILINPGIDKLTLIPGGKPVYNAPELLSSSRMEEMMSEIKNRYPSDRLIIVDGPAMLPFPDAVILSRYVDGVLPVVELERTPIDQLKKMMDSLKDTPIIGTVLNKNRG